MATIKEIIQNFCYRINIPAPISFVGVSSPAELQYLALFKEIGDNLRNRPYQWPQLKRGYTFTTVEDERKIQLPGDFYRMLRSDQWDATNLWPLVGPVSDYFFDARQFLGISLQTRKAFRVIGATNYLYSTSPYSQRSAGWFEIDPAAENSTDELFIGYISCNWVWPRDWVASTPYTAGDIRAGEGYMYRAANTATSSTTRPSHATGSVYDGGGSSGVQWAVYTEPYSVISTNTNLNDADLCLFDDDIMIDGMRWAYLRSKGLDFQSQRVDWENQVKSSFARFNGVTKGNMCQPDEDEDDWPNIPSGNWDV